MVFTSIATGQGWVGAKLVWPPDSTAPHMDDLLPVSDNNGNPWLLWKCQMARELSRWEGSRWGEAQSVPDTINPSGSYWNAIFDDSNRLFLIYPMRPYGNLCDIHSVRYNPATGEWGLPVQVNAPETTSLDDYSPRIDEGGGQVWATWFNETENRCISDIKASQWNEAEHCWGPELTVNQDTGGINRMQE